MRSFTMFVVIKYGSPGKRGILHIDDLHLAPSAEVVKPFTPLPPEYDVRCGETGLETTANVKGFGCMHPIKIGETDYPAGFFCIPGGRSRLDE